MKKVCVMFTYPSQGMKGELALIPKKHKFKFKLGWQSWIKNRVRWETPTHTHAHAQTQIKAVIYNQNSLNCKRISSKIT